MNTKDVRKKVEAALELLSETSTTRSKFESVRALIKGINPKIDELLSLCSRELSNLEKIEKGAVIDLTLENLPEHTEQQKKRKKALLLLLRHWNDLKGEVERVRKELEQAREHGNSPQSSTALWGRIFSFAKGPLGITTLVAVGVVAILQLISVRVIIKNVDCEPLNLSLVPVPLPGLSLPRDPIPSGEQGVATLPPISVSVDGTKQGRLKINLLGFAKEFEFGRYNISLDGAPISGRQTNVSLGERKVHEVVVSCR